VATKINGILIGIVAKAHWYHVQVTVLVDSRQPAQTLALQILNFGRSESAHYCVLHSSGHHKKSHSSAWKRSLSEEKRQPI
jgi:hypothetical protein